jgi:hypothetical protein
MRTPVDIRHVQENNFKWTVTKNIRIHLADGTPLGIRQVEIANWSGQAIYHSSGQN